jgi:SAM-dependent methyltransferase
MSDVTPTSTYAFDNAWHREHDRLRAIEALFDQSTRGHLADRGAALGGRCLEVGFGAGGVARWMAQQVGAAGHVVAVDVDTRFGDASGWPQLEIRQANILDGDLEEGYFDLAHARAVIEHIPEHEAALERMIAAVRPGGWLVIEDVDFGGPTAAVLAKYVYPPQYQDIVERIFRAVEAVFRSIGASATFGPRLPGILKELGLTEVGGEVRAPIIPGGSSQFVSRSAEQLRPRLVETGLVTDEEVHAFLEMAADPASDHLPPMLVSVWGRR